MSDTQVVQSSLLERVIATLSDFNESRTAIIPRLMKVTSDTGTPSHEIAHLLAYDPALTATVVRLANSAFYGRLRSVASLPEAVAVLGVTLLRSLVVAASLASLYRGDDEDEDLKRLLWDHSLAAALGARILALHRKSSQREELFLAGLVHDLAQLVLLVRFPKEYKPILLSVLKNGGDLCERERELLGVTHEHLGAVMLTQWNFPPRVIEIVRCHNNPDDQGPQEDGSDDRSVREMAHVICFTDELAHSLGFGCRKPMASELNQHPSAQFLGLSDEDIVQISDELKVQFAEEQKLFEGAVSANGGSSRLRAQRFTRA